MTVSGRKVIFFIFIIGTAVFFLVRIAVHRLPTKQADHTPIPQDTDVTHEDINADGKPDGFFYRKDGILFRINRDRNFDGRLDEWIDVQNNVWTHRKADDSYDRIVDVEESFTAEGRITERMYDLDHDGHMDFTEYFDTESGVTHAAQDTNKDGKPDVWKFYENRLVVRREVDGNFDGKADRWTYFNADGTAAKEEFDKDFDGKKDLTR